MREPYRDLYSLFRHEPEAELYFNSLPSHVQDQIGANYRSVDSLERLRNLARRAEQRSPLEGPGELSFPPRFSWF